MSSPPRVMSISNLSFTATHKIKLFSFNSVTKRLKMLPSTKFYSETLIGKNDETVSD